MSPRLPPNGRGIIHVVLEGANMFIASTKCPVCEKVVEVNADLSEGVPSRVTVECENGHIIIILLGWEPRVWIEGIEKVVNLPERATELRNEAQAPKHSGLDREQTMYECGNCGVPRFVHGVILEACPNCGDDETDLSLYADVP
jgi:Zn ribbon nucleic-acid-binding protein